MDYKDPTSNHERRLLAIIDNERKNMSFGKIALEISIQNNKISVVEISSVKKTIKISDEKY